MLEIVRIHTLSHRLMKYAYPAPIGFQHVTFHQTAPPPALRRPRLPFACPSPPVYSSPPACFRHLPASVAHLPPIVYLLPVACLPPIACLPRRPSAPCRLSAPPVAYRTRHSPPMSIVARPTLLFPACRTPAYCRPHPSRSVLLKTHSQKMPLLKKPRLAIIRCLAAEKATFSESSPVRNKHGLKKEILNEPFIRHYRKPLY